VPVGPDYRLQVGDEVEVRFYRTPEMNTTVKVRSDGRISLELLDDVEAAGLRPAELDRLLTERYGKELLDPKITVVVKQFGGQRIYVGGEVGRPGALALSGAMTALQAIDEAGGFKETAALDDVVLIRRDEAGKAIGSVLDLARATQGRSFEGDVPLRAYDVLFVPRTPIADLDLFVDQYIRQLIPVAPNIQTPAF
jgi:protein involved in polysaccharide export with SLBB domain